MVRLLPLLLLSACATLGSNTGAPRSPFTVKVTGQVQLDVPASCLSAQVPVLLLQTLVENAVKHGIARCPAGGAVIVTARKQNGVLSIEVTNPSPQTPASAESTGLGLVNTRERLRLLFGEHAQVELSAVGALTTARVSVPCP